MQCPHCQSDIKDQAKFCKHCGQPISEHNHGHMMESKKELAQSEVGTDASSFTTPHSHDFMQIEQQEDVHNEIEEDKQEDVRIQSDKPILEEPSHASETRESIDDEAIHKASRYKFSYVLALIAAGSSALFVWILGVLISFITNKSLLTTLWSYIATNVLALPIEKSVLFEQQFKSSIWFIVNSFIGGQYTGKYSVNGDLFTSFQISMPIILAILVMLCIVCMHLKAIAIVLRKRQNSVSLLQKTLISIVYFIATWLLIIVPLFIISPKLHIPFIEAPEQIKIGISFFSSLLYTALIFKTAAIFVWLPWKKWRKTRRFFLISTIFISLLALSQLYVQLWNKPSLSFQQLAGLHPHGLDLLWLNRFVAELLMSFGGHVENTSTFFITMLHLPTASSWYYSLVFIIGVFLILVSQSVKATWTELISIVAVSSWLIFIANQLTHLSLLHHMNDNMMVEINMLYQLGSISSLLIPIGIVVLLTAAAKLVAPLLKNKPVTINKGWLKHIVQRKRLYAGLVILLLISALTVFNIISQNHNRNAMSSDTIQYEHQWAKQIYLMQQAPPDYVLMQANAIWAEQGTEESKALLAIAYLQAHQPIKAQQLLNESLLSKNKLFTKEQLTALRDASDLENPLSAIQKSVQVASVENEEVEYLLDHAIESYVTPIVMETLQDVEQEVLPKLVGEALTDMKVEMQIEPQYVDFMKVLMPDMIEQLQQVYVEASNNLDEDIRMQEQIANELRDANEVVTEQELVTINDKVNRTWQTYVQKETPQLLALAKAAIYYGEPSRAEKWLSLIHLYGSEQQEAAVLLASLYLNGQEPSLQATQSTAYEQALNETAQLIKEKYQAILKDYEVTTNQQLEEKIDSSYVNQNLQTQLAYALLLPYEEGADTDVLYQLAKYHYQAGQLEEANKKIEALEKKVDELEVKQQYVIQKLNELPADTSNMTVEQLQQKHELTEELYINLEPSKGIAFSEQPLTSEQQAFSVYLSNQLLSFKKSSAQITSVQYDDGTVTLYARSDNAEITKKGLKLFDNDDDITDYELTKLSETSSFERFVMLILDQSGSMDGQKIEVATQSATQFVHAFEHKESVGLVPFSDSYHLAVPFTKNYMEMEQALSSLTADGGTDIAPALMLGVNELEAAAGERIAFIISDGEDSNFSNPAVRQQIIQEANASGITIYAVGFDAGYQTLRDVAEGTGGQYISATDFESLSRSFDTIRETLSRTYQIKYKVDPTAYGQHTVNLEQDEYSDSKTYTIEDPNAVYFPAGDNDSDGFTVEQPKQKADVFSVTSYTPRKIVASKSGSTTITIEGTKLNEVEKITFDDKAIDFKLINNSKITVNVSNKQPIGTHKLKLVTKAQKQETLSISYANSAAQQSVKFGYATLYGDFIETKGGQVTLVGDTSVDKFIYTTGDKMVLKNDEELTFTGMSLKINNTILRQFNDGFSMTASNFGKTFSISPHNPISEAVSSLPGLDRFGIELKLARVFTYNADMKSDDGTLNIRGGMTNFYKLYMLNKNIGKLKIKNTPIKWLPSDASLSGDYAKTGYTLSGTASVSLFMQGIGFDGVTLSFTYPQADKRLILKGQVTGMELFKMKTTRQNSTRITVEVGLHHANGLDRIGGELASNLSVPLGATGLALYKFGFLADWSAKNAGSVTLGIDTVIDKAYSKFVGSIAKIPVVNKIFDFDPAMCIVCVDGTVGFTEIASTNWGLNGKVTAELIGFKMAEVNTKVNKNEFELQSMQNKLIYTLDTHANIVFSDSNFKNHTTLKYLADFDAVGLNPHTFTVVYVPAKFDYSFAELTKEKNGKTVKVQRIGNQLNIIK